MVQLQGMDAHQRSDGGENGPTGPPYTGSHRPFEGARRGGHSHAFLSAMCLVLALSSCCRFGPCSFCPRLHLSPYSDSTGGCLYDVGWLAGLLLASGAGGTGAHQHWTDTSRQRSAIQSRSQARAKTQQPTPTADRLHGWRLARPGWAGGRGGVDEGMSGRGHGEEGKRDMAGRGDG